MNQRSSSESKLSRRHLLQGTASAAAVGAMAWAGTAEADKKDKAKKDKAAKGKKVAAKPLKGNINHSIVHWCFSKHWDIERTCQIAKQLGCKSVELVGPDTWDTLKKYDLVCAIAGSHLFMQGMNNPKYQPMCI